MKTAEWRVLIADDEPAARRGVRQLLRDFPEFIVIGECRDGSELLSSLEVLTPHVVFLDIQMPGIDGFEVIRRRTPEQMPTVVFLTAHDQFAVRAFEAQALDYLLKPVSENRFAKTVKRLTTHLPVVCARREARVVAATRRGMVAIPAASIEWIEASGNYSRVWTRGRSYLVREALNQLESRLRPSGFRRVHRGGLVSLSAIQELQWTETHSLTAILTTGAKIPVSRRRRASLVAALRVPQP